VNEERFYKRLEAVGIYYNEEINLADSFKEKILIAWRDKAICKAARIFKNPDLQADYAASELISLMRPALRNVASYLAQRP
jgi:hypothetical protein